ncbi:MAG: hypothetical protein SGI71_04205 [Verrucomicrobiota bacterium]|nr:hypothetical protein [Verrucomicrobiota bacterium]
MTNPHSDPSSSDCFLTNLERAYTIEGELLRELPVVAFKAGSYPLKVVLAQYLNTAEDNINRLKEVFARVECTPTMLISVVSPEVYSSLHRIISTQIVSFTTLRAVLIELHSIRVQLYEDFIKCIFNEPSLLGLLQENLQAEKRMGTAILELETTLQMQTAA